MNKVKDRLSPVYSQLDIPTPLEYISLYVRH